MLSAAFVTIALLAGLTHVSAAQEVPEDTTTTTSTEDSTTTTTSPEETTTTTTADTTTTTTPAPPAVEEDEDGPIALVVPTPGANQSVITVKVGGDRSGLSGVLPRAGVTLQLFDNATTTTPTTFVTPNTCVSDADGDCNWLVLNTGGSIFNPGINRDRQFFVRQVGTPANTFANPTLNVGTNSWPATSYQFETCPNLDSGSICRSTATGDNGFMQSTGDEVTASGGIWQTSRANPALPARCGLRVALVLDLSGSVGAQLPALQTAATTFVNSLVGTPSSVGLFTFASNGPANTTNNANRALTSVSTTAGASTVNGWINGTTVQTTAQYTNWDRALNQVTESAQPYDIALVVTDGNPTAYGSPATTQTDGTTRFREVENGIFSANGLKLEGTRVIAFGVGAGVNQSGQNLRSISGPTLNSDYFQTTDYPAAAGVLRALALGSCSGSVSVIKQVIPPGGTTANAAPAPGWTFGATTSTSGVTISPTSGATDVTGGVSFGLTFPGGVTSAPVTVTETQKSGYTLVRQGGSVATCTNLNTVPPTAVPTTNVGALGFQVATPSTNAISCVVYNRAPDPPATIQVDKQWVVNGVTYANGAQPPGLSAQLTLNSATAGFGTAIPGFIQGQQVAISETVTSSLPLCTVTSRTVTLANGTAVNVAVAPPPYNATLIAGANTYQIRNVVTCTSSLQLAKTVVGGPAPPESWTLRAVTPSGALPGPIGATGSAGATANVTPGVTYPLAESGGPADYVQDVAPGAVLIPGSTGSWACIQVDAAGNQIPGFGDGVNGGVTVPLGQRVRCTATNRTVELVLRKVVINDFGGTATPANWNLTVTPTGTPPPGVVAKTVTGSLVGAVLQVRPGQTYTLSEAGGPPGYALQSIECGGSPVTSITPQIGQTPICTFTNRDVQPTLTLVKTVTNDNGGTAAAGAWTLAADGPTDISGATGTAGVTGAPVNAGTYILSESGPTGYTAGAWSCTAGTLTGSSLVLPLGVNATCTINNNDQPASLRLSKVVDNGAGAGDALATDFTLTATPQAIPGQGTVTGAGGVPVTPVFAGSYVLSETTVPGYAPGTWSCTGGVLTGTTVVVPSGGVVACQITNTAAAPRLTLVKQVVNNNGGTTPATAWTLTATGPTTISGPTADPLVTNRIVQVGTYALTESTIPGYTASNWVCVGAASSTATTVTLDSGQSATCTITNDDQPASLALSKVVDNGDGAGDAVAAEFTLTATPQGIPGQGVVSGAGGVPTTAVFAGSYFLSETTVPGYTAGTWSCTGGVVTGSTVVVLNGGVVACEITNTAVAPTLTLVKEVVNNSGGTVPASAWVLTATGPTSISGPTEDPLVTDAVVEIGTYALTESTIAGYTASDWVCVGAGISSTATTVTLDSGQSATCTITNDDIAPSLALDKVVTNNNGGTAVDTDWTLTASPNAIAGQGPLSGAGAVAATDVLPGTYTLSESAGPDGYEASAWSCVGTTAFTDTTVTVALGETVTCTITNDDVAASLALDKVVTNNNGGTAVKTDWTLTASPNAIAGQGPLSGAGAVAATDVLPGTYTLSESAGPDGYEASAWSCVGTTAFTGTTVTVALGETVSCTITNDDVGASLALTKVVTNNNGGTAVPTAWTLTASPNGIVGQGPLSGAGSVPATGVLPGTYTLSESGGPTGYTPSAWVCVGATSSTATTVTVALDQAVTCTITNDDQPASLALSKVVDNGDGAGDAVAADFTLTATPTPAIPGQGTVSGAGGVPATAVFAGSYVLSETTVPGYTPGTWSCTGGVVTGSTVVVLNGGVVACEITNTAVAPTLTLVKEVVNDNGGTTPASAWVLTATGPTTIEGPTADPLVTDAVVEIGTYALTESTIPGYEASDWECEGTATSSTATTVTLDSGQSATCTITNDDIAPSLALDKVVTNDNGGTAVDTDWTLTASPNAIAGQGPLAGAGAVAATDVLPGTYTLSESGPDGYEASAWSCVGTTTFTDTTVTVALGQTVTCSITNDDQPAELTLVKSVINDDGGPEDESAWELTATGPTAGVSGITGSDEVTNRTVDAGTYILSEDGPAGYFASPWECDAGTFTGDRLVLPPGVSATCTIVNDDIGPGLTLIKTVTNDNGGTAAATDWTLSAVGPDTITGTTPVSEAVDAGIYTLSEADGPAGYTAGPWSCDSGILVGATLILPPGVGVVCTINNDDQPAELTLRKVVDNGTTGATNGPTDWTVTATPVSIPGQGVVTGNGDPSSPAGVDEVVVFAGAYDLEESGPSGYTASDWTCTGGTLSGSRLTVPSGGSADCSITNTAIVPTLTLVKEVDNGNGAGTAEATDWTLTAEGETEEIFGPTGSDEVTDAPVPIGTYTLSETGPAGYTPSDWSCVGGTSTTSSVTLALDESATCTITNTAVAPTLTLVKEVVNDNGGTTPASAWTLTATGPTTISGPTGNPLVTDAVVEIGTYALTETTIPGYEASDWDCEGNASSSTATTVTLDSGQSATCTITNDDQPASLALTKVVDNGDGAGDAEADDFTLTATPTPAIPGQGVVSGAGGVPATPVFAGSYVLSETTVPGYTPGTWSCTGGVVTGSTVVALNGGVVACEITNTAVAPTLTLVKEVINDNGGTEPATAWTLTGTGPTTISGPTGDPLVTDAVVEVGTYALTESTIPGYTASDWDCEGTATSSTATTVTLDSGQSATCTITNDDQPASLALTKVVDNGDGAGDAEADDFTLTATPQAITGQGPISGAGGVPATEVFAGSYFLSETTVPGYTPGTWSCAGGVVTGSTVVVPNGGVVACEITNTAVAPTLTLVKEVVNDDGGTTPATAWTLTATGPTTISGPTADPLVTDAVVEIGTYALTESTIAGYEASEWDCEGTGISSTATSVTLDTGQSATCTITNDDIAPSLALDKVVTNDNGGTAVPTDWTLTASPNAIAGQVPLSGAGAVAATDVLPGTYTLSESAGPEGYEASEWVCVGATSFTATTVTIALDQTVSCTITNDDEAASLALTKVVDNGDGAGDAEADDFTLTATPTPAIPGQGVVSGAGGVPATPVFAGSYVLSETTVPGYTAGTWSCTGGVVTGSTVVVLNGGVVACEITNTAVAPTLTLVKEVVNDNGGTTPASAWVLTGTGPTTISGPTGDPLVTDAVVEIGTYALTESTIAGYTASDWICEGDASSSTATTVTLDSGQSATCTITNDDEAASLALTKVVDNGDGAGDAEADEFTLTATPQAITGQGPISGAGGVPATEVFAGSYVLSETTVPGYTPGTWSCTGGVVTGSTVVVLNGGVVACEITNTAVAPTLTLVKEVINDNGGTTPASAWVLTGTGPTTIEGPTADPLVTDAVVEVGTYALTESTIPGYTASDWVCEGTATSSTATTVTLDSGQAATCTITNDDQQATLALDKVVINDNGGTAVDTDWTLTADLDGQEVLSGAGGVAATDVLPGTYTLSEDGPPDYRPSAWRCVGTTSFTEDTVTVALGENVSCTIINDDGEARLTLVKEVVNDSGGTATPDQWTLSAAGRTPITGVTGDAAVTDALVSPGRYILSEADGPLGYTPSDWACTDIDGEPVSATPLVLGDEAEVTCTIVNDDQTAWTMAKTAEPPTGSIVDAGTTVTYTIAATKTDGVDPTDITITDDLSDVLDDATLVTGSVNATAGDASVAGSILTWTIPTLVESETVSYQVMVDSDSGAASLVNVATGTGVTPPTDCALPVPATTAAFVGGRSATLKVAAALAAQQSVACTTTHTARVPAGPGADPPVRNVSNNGRTLPFTGNDPVSLVRAALLLLILGAGIVVGERRRSGPPPAHLR